MIRYTLLLLPLVLALSLAQDPHSLCSQGDLNYLCQNYDVCSQFGFIDADIRAALCLAQDDYAPTLSYPPVPTTDPTYPPTTDRFQTTDFQRRFPTTSYPDSEVTSDTGVETRATEGWISTEVTEGWVSTEGTEGWVSTEATEGWATRDSFTGRTSDATTEPYSIEFGSEYSTEETNYGVAPVIKMPPVNITVAPGGTAEFGCTAMGSPTPQTTITKKEETAPLPLDAFPAATSNMLSETTIIQQMDNIVKSNEGWYTCMACNHYGCAQHDAYLTVLDLCADVSCNAPLKCKADYTTLTASCSCPEFCDRDGLTKPEFVCSNYCEVKFNECQLLRDACAAGIFDAQVAYKGYCQRTFDPEIDLESSTAGTMTLTEGSELRLECHADGSPQPEIMWYKEGVVGVVGYGEILEKSTVGLGDSGAYYCEAVNCKRNRARGELVDVTVTPAAVPTTAPFTTTYFDDAPGNLIINAPHSTCQVFGDPHFLTYDMKAFDYMGSCDYLLAMDCQTAGWFIYGRMRPCGIHGGSCLESVTVYVGTEILELQRGWLVNRGGKKISPKNHRNEEMTIEGPSGNTTLFFDGSILELSTELELREVSPGTFQRDMLLVRWDGLVSLTIQTPMSANTCGMCGNNDGDDSNDMRTRRNGLTDNADVFGDSWKIDRFERCEDAAAPLSLEAACGARLENVTAECERVFDIENFAQCPGLGHNKTEFIKACIYDECEEMMQQSGIPPRCIVAQAYATRCGNYFWARADGSAKSSHEVVGWEEEAGCPTSEEKFQAILDTGCPQPSLEEENEAA